MQKASKKIKQEWRREKLKHTLVEAFNDLAEKLLLERALRLAVNVEQAMKEFLQAVKLAWQRLVSERKVPVQKQKSERLLCMTTSRSMQLHKLRYVRQIHLHHVELAIQGLDDSTIQGYRWISRLSLWL